MAHGGWIAEFGAGEGWLGKQFAALAQDSVGLEIGVGGSEGESARGRFLAFESGVRSDSVTNGSVIAVDLCVPFYWEHSFGLTVSLGVLPWLSSACESALLHNMHHHTLSQLVLSWPGPNADPKADAGTGAPSKGAKWCPEGAPNCADHEHQATVLSHFGLEFDSVSTEGLRMALAAAHAPDALAETVSVWARRRTSTAATCPPPPS